MDETPSTQTSLLVRLRDAQDTEAWQHFVELYAPLVYRFARKHHLQDADAADLTQDVLHAVSKNIKKLDYEPKLGSFRGWLFTIAHRRMCDFLDQRNRKIQVTGDSNLQDRLNEIAAPASELWHREFQKRLFLWAAEVVQPEFTETTWRAFWKTAVDNEPISDVAERFGLTVGAVYVARSRVQSRLREQIQKANED